MDSTHTLYVIIGSQCGPKFGVFRPGVYFIVILMNIRENQTEIYKLCIGFMNMNQLIIRISIIMYNLEIITQEATLKTNQ